jgi:uncharacterized protein (DUF697 family)
MRLAFSALPASSISLNSSVYLTTAIDRDRALKIMMSVAKGAAAYIGGSKIISSALHLIPGVGTLGTVGLNAAFNATYTYKLGLFLCDTFDKATFDIDDADNLISEIINAIIPTVSDVLGLPKR